MRLPAAHMHSFAWPAASLSFCLLATKVASVALSALCIFGALYCAYALVCWMQTETVFAAQVGRYTLKDGLSMGSRIEKGNSFGTIEAMKMIIYFQAPYSGRITGGNPALLRGERVDLVKGDLALQIQKDLL